MYMCVCVCVCGLWITCSNSLHFKTNPFRGNTEMLFVDMTRKRLLCFEVKWEYIETLCILFDLSSVTPPFGEIWLFSCRELDVNIDNWQDCSRRQSVPPPPKHQGNVQPEGYLVMSFIPNTQTPDCVSAHSSLPPALLPFYISSIGCWLIAKQSEQLTDCQPASSQGQIGDSCHNNIIVSLHWARA